MDYQVNLPQAFQRSSFSLQQHLRPMLQLTSAITRPLHSATVALGVAVALSSTASVSHASAIIPGSTGEFEQGYLEFILGHHYSGLRPTELAVGTDTVGPTESDPYPGNPPSFPSTPAKATDSVVMDIAIASNAAQRMEIDIGQGFLQDWYGSTATLELPSGGELIDTLEGAEPGDPFNIEFLIGFSEHHIAAIYSSLECVNRAGHEELRNYCAGIVQSQTEGVLTMRDQLQTEYGIDFNPSLPGDGASEVPEPATLGLLAGGLAFMGFMRRRASTRFAAD